MCDPYHSSAASDVLLVEAALAVQDDWLRGISVDWVKTVCATCKELASHARFIHDRRHLPQDLLNGFLIS